MTASHQRQDPTQRRSGLADLAVEVADRLACLAVGRGGSLGGEHLDQHLARRIDRPAPRIAVEVEGRSPSTVPHREDAQGLERRRPHRRTTPTAAQRLPNPGHRKRELRVCHDRPSAVRPLDLGGQAPRRRLPLGIDPPNEGHLADRGEQESADRDRTCARLREDGDLGRRSHGLQGAEVGSEPHPTGRGDGLAGDNAGDADRLREVVLLSAGGEGQTGDNDSGIGTHGSGPPHGAAVIALGNRGVARARGPRTSGLALGVARAGDRHGVMHGALERVEVEVLGGRLDRRDLGFPLGAEPADAGGALRLPTGDAPHERIGHHQQTTVGEQVDGADRLGTGDAQPASEDHHGVTASGDGQPAHPRDLGAIDPLGLIPHRVGMGSYEGKAGRARQVEGEDRMGHAPRAPDATARRDRGSNRGGQLTTW